MATNLTVKDTEAIVIRSIEEKDNTSIACVLRASVEEHDAPKVGTFYDDPHTDMMFQAFSIKDAEYWVVECNGTNWAVVVFIQLKVYQKVMLNCQSFILARSLEVEE